jgi:zinc protease
MRWFGIAATALLIVLLSAPRPGAAAEETTTALENGLQVTLKPLATGDKVALVIVYDLGEDHDPAGRSGLAHLVEHCYVTCAAGQTPVRTAEEMMARYPQAWNAQTGARYTVVAFVFPKERLAAEVEEAAARMGALRITQADLEREVPRMRAELANMFDSASPLAASNRAWMQVRPGPAGSQKGGVIEQIEKLTVQDVRDWHAKHYKPVNARLVLVGPFATETGRDLVAKHFGPIAKGEPAAARAPGPAPEASVAEAGRRGGWAARAWRVPTCDSADYAPFLVFAHRLFTRAMARGATGRDPILQFAPLDAPEVLTVTTRIQPDESTADAVARIDAWLAGAWGEPVGQGEGAFAGRNLGFLLGTIEVPDAQVAMNPYGAAFGIARRAQLGLDGEALGRALAAVDQAAFDAMRERVFGKERGSTAAVVDPHPAR